MDFTGGQWAQLISALTLGVVFFVAAYVLPARWMVGLMIILAPFQFIASRFGTLNIVLIYLIGVAFLLRGRIRRYPLGGFLLLILFAYLLSFSQALRATYFDHILYLIQLTANVLLFYVAYNYFRDNDDLDGAITMFVWMNVLVVLYCLIQLATGVERFAFMGVGEFALAGMDVERQRLVGPFGAPGTNGEFFALQVLLLGYLVVQRRGTAVRRLTMLSLILANFGFLVMTGSRGSFLAMVGGAALFLILFRRQLGLGRMVRVGAISLGLFAVVIAVVLNYSQYNILFERFAKTEIRGGLPDTREKAFKFAWERIPENLMLGHGPRLRLVNEHMRSIRGYEGLPYPHNLYLFLAYTVGLVGLFAYLMFFGGLFRWWWRARRLPIGDSFMDGLPTLGILLLVVFMVDQLKVEFLRVRLSDHQQYMFALWAVLLAFTEPVRRRAIRDAQAAAEEEERARERALDTTALA